MSNSSFLQAFKGTNSTIPVWFMRQAGRFLPEYRKIKEKHTLKEMFEIPDIAAEVTCLPIDILGVDAAILFADILTLPIAMGAEIEFDSLKGPVVQPLANVSQLHKLDNISHVTETIHKVKTRLNQKVPLIGFAGSPFTVATYLLEGGSSLNFSKTFDFLYNNTEEFHKLMHILTMNTVDYLNAQKDAGIDAFQIFDTWAGVLRQEEYQRFVLPYVQQIFKAVELPSIYYAKNAFHLLSDTVESHADFLSICHTIKIGEEPLLTYASNIGIQGNLYNALLYADYSIIEREVNRILEASKKHKSFIFNLNHGILPNMNPDKLKFVVEKVHAFTHSHV